MRITTQMLNASMRKAGLPVNNVSLLNYINGSNNQSSLLNALNKNGIKIPNQSYEKLKSQAEKLQQAAEKMSSEDAFKEARTSGDLQAICDNAQEMIKNYNSTVKALKNTSSPLNQYYRQMLGEAFTDDNEKLGEIGITKGSDGTLKLDIDKMKQSGIDKIEELLGSDGTFSSKLSFLADRIADNAKANASSAFSQYNALGNNYFASASKYDFWG